jgi:hypothetical protein
MMVLPHFFDGDDWPFSPRRYRTGNTVRILHAGALYWTRRPDVLVKGFLQYRQTAGKPAMLQMLGSCAPEIAETLSGLTRDEGIYLKGGVTQSQARAAIEAADILVIIDCDLPQNVHLPSKVADYAAACKPILYIGRPDSPTCRVLSKVHPAFVQATTAESVSSALSLLADLAYILPPEAYRAAYRSLEAQSVLSPLIAAIREHA